MWRFWFYTWCLFGLVRAPTKVIFEQIQKNLQLFYWIFLTTSCCLTSICFKFEILVLELRSKRPRYLFVNTWLLIFGVEKLLRKIGQKGTKRFVLVWIIKIIKIKLRSSNSCSLFLQLPVTNNGNYCIGDGQQDKDIHCSRTCDRRWTLRQNCKMLPEIVFSYVISILWSDKINILSYFLSFLDANVFELLGFSWETKGGWSKEVFPAANKCCGLLSQQRCLS